MTLQRALAVHPAAAEKHGRSLSFFEFWPGWLFYTPVVIHWLLLGLRYRDFSLPTAATRGSPPAACVANQSSPSLTRSDPRLSIWSHQPAASSADPTPGPPPKPR